MGMNLPAVPGTRQNEDEFIEVVPDSYRVGCREAIATWLEDAMENGTFPLDAIYCDILKKAISSSRACDAHIWGKKDRRTQLRLPVLGQTGDTEIQSDTAGPFVIFAGKRFAPQAGSGHYDNIGRNDRSAGGVRAGDKVTIGNDETTERHSGAPISINVLLPDGRKLYWARTGA